MEVGELKITGSIDTINIEKGINGIIIDMKKVSTTSQSVNSDFERMSQQANRLAVALGVIAGSAALLNLAKSAPQVAPAMAAIDLAMFKLSMTLGQILQPAFSWVADKLNKLADWAAEHPDLFGAVTTSIIGLGIALAVFKISTAFAGFMAFLTNPVVLTVALGIWAVYNAIKAIFDLFGEKKKTAEDIGKLIGTLVGGIGGGIAGFAVGGPGGAALGAAGGALVFGGLGGLFGKAIGNMINPGSQGYYGSTTPTTNKTSSTNSSTQALLDLLNQTNQNQLRRNIALNLTSLN